MVSVSGIGVGNGAVRPRLVTRKDLELGFDRRRSDATLSHFRGLNKSNIETK